MSVGMATKKSTDGMLLSRGKLVDAVACDVAARPLSQAASGEEVADRVLSTSDKLRLGKGRPTG
jgi:hypothetical protein